MKIKSIMPVGEADVYNMEVDDTHDYAVNNGTIVHNCRYILMEHPMTPRIDGKAASKVLVDALDVRQKDTTLIKPRKLIVEIKE